MTVTKTPTDILKEEHQAVLGKLAALEEIFNNLDYREKVAGRLTELAAFFDKTFWLHFDKEEKALFPEFDNFMPRGAGPLAVMLDEHETLRNTNEVMQGAITKYLQQDDTPEVKKAIRQNGTHFIEFLRGHISKEDGLLFRMAEMHLKPEQNERVVKLFLEMEKKTGI